MLKNSNEIQQNQKPTKKTRTNKNPDELLRQNRTQDQDRQALTESNK